MSGILPFLIIGATQSLFSSLLIITKKPFQLENAFLSILLFIIFLEFNLYILNIYDIFSYQFPVLQFTISPLLFLFVNAATRTNITFKIKYIFHLLPFIAFTLILIYSDPTHNILESKHLSFNKNFYFRIFISFSLFLSIIIYMTLSLRILYKYQKNISSVFSYKSFKNSLNWVKLIVIIMSTGYLSLFSYSLLLFLGIIKTEFNPLGIIAIFYVIISYLIGFFGYRQPTFFNLPSETNETAEKLVSNEIEKKEIEQILSRLNESMIDKKSYLKGDLTVKDLATEINVSRTVLTQILNKNLNKNFYKYINEFRIEEAKKLLVNPKYKNFSILAIGYEAGFNSKSTFNAIFKTNVGITPSEFKKQHLID